MTFQTEDELRKARTLQSGEYLAFNPFLIDSAAARGATLQADAAPAAAARFAQMVDKARREHAERFAFMGDRAPKFDQARAEFLARAAITSEPGRAVRDAVRASRDSVPYAMPAQSSASPASATAAPAFDGRQIRDAARRYRYT
jgi:hypothetical protein